VDEERTVERTTAALRARLDGRAPQVLLTLGSGLGAVAEAVTDAVSIDVLDLPGTAASTVPGHTARLICGTLGGREVLVQAGRIHLYEGHSAHDVTRLVRVAARLGASTFVVTNAAGGLDQGFTPGDLMVIDDHLNLTGTSPLQGLLRGGAPRFVDMAGAYDAGLRDLAHRVAGDAGLRLRRGVYAGLVGPAYETPAEVAMLRTLGAHAVGMSTVNEVIAARDEGLRVLGFSSVTNVHGEGVATTHDEVVEVGARAAKDLQRVLLGLFDRLDEAG
jgi:purine-nucleoside phosphorylase